MTSGTGGMGMGKHRTSGKSPKSPKLRHALKRQAEMNEIKAKPTNCVFTNVSDVFKGK